MTQKDIGLITCNPSPNLYVNDQQSWEPAGKPVVGHCISVRVYLHDISPSFWCSRLKVCHCKYVEFPNSLSFLSYVQNIEKNGAQSVQIDYFEEGEEGQHIEMVNMHCVCHLCTYLRGKESLILNSLLLSFLAPLYFVGSSTRGFGNRGKSWRQQWFSWARGIFGGYHK